MSKFIYVHSSSGYKQSLEEILAKQEIKKLVKDTQCIDESAVIERFNETLAKDMDKVFFGLKSFNIAYEKNAIAVLIFTDGFLRKLSPIARKNISPLFNKLKTDGVEMFKLSSQHVGGEKIDSFGGLVGILTYPLEEIAEIGMEDMEGEGEDVKETEEDQGDLDNEKLKGMMENNCAYNEDGEESKKEEPVYKDKGAKKKGGKGNAAKKAAFRKRSGFDDEDDMEDE